MDVNDSYNLREIQHYRNIFIPIYKVRDNFIDCLTSLKKKRENFLKIKRN